MEKIRIVLARRTFILYQNEVREVRRESLFVFKVYDVRKLQKVPQEIEWLRQNGYYYESKGLKYIPCIELLINEEKSRFEEEQRDGYTLSYRYRITFCKDISMKDIQSFYDFYLEIEIDGMRMQVEASQAYVDAVYVDPEGDEKLKQLLTHLLGGPKIIPEQGSEPCPPYYYIVPISKIDKIIGIKKYRDLSNWGKYPEEYIQEEEIVLDLHHFDLETYKIFEQHEMLCMYNDEEPEDKFKYELIKPV